MQKVVFHVVQPADAIIVMLVSDVDGDHHCV